MQVFAKNRYRFLRPRAALLSPPAEKGGAQVMQKQVDFTEAFFELEPGQFQDAPDWIKDDQMFKWATQSGDIKVVEKGTDTSLPSPPPESPEHEKPEHEKLEHERKLPGRR